MSREAPTGSGPFGPGFQRDASVVLLAEEQETITKREARRNLRLLGMDLDPDPDINLTTPSLEQPESTIYIFDETHVIDITNNHVYEYDPLTETIGELVGIFTPEDEGEYDDNPASGDQEPEDEYPPADVPDDEPDPELVPPPVDDDQIDDDGKTPPS